MAGVAGREGNSLSRGRSRQPQKRTARRRAMPDFRLRRLLFITAHARYCCPVYCRLRYPRSSFHRPPVATRRHVQMLDRLSAFRLNRRAPKSEEDRTRRDIIFARAAEQEQPGARLAKQAKMPSATNEIRLQRRDSATCSDSSRRLLPSVHAASASCSPTARCRHH